MPLSLDANWSLNDNIIVYRNNFWDNLSSSKICYRDRPSDRFIPTRNRKQMDVASFLLSKENQPVDTIDTTETSVSIFFDTPT